MEKPPGTIAAPPHGRPGSRAESKSPSSRKRRKTRLPVRELELNAAFGIGMTLLGTIVAVFMIPEDPSPAGALRPSAIIMSLALIAPMIRVVFSTPASIFHPVTLLVAAPVYWLMLDLIQGAYDMPLVQPENARTSFVAIGVFCTAVWLGSYIKPIKLPRIVREAATIRLTPKSLFAIGMVAFFLAFMRFAIPSGFDFGAMVATFGKSRWSAPWARGSLGGWDAFLDHMGYFGYVLPPLTAFMMRKEGVFHWRSILLLMATLIIMALFSTGGGRRIIGVMVGSGLVVWFVSSERPKIRDFVVLGLIVATTLAFLQLMLIYRGKGLSNIFAEETRVNESQYEHLHVDDNFFRLAQITSIVPSNHPYVGHKWITWVVIRPIPRVLWPSKPIDPGFNLATHLDKKGVSLTMSLIGELYMSRGLPACAAGGALLGWLCVTLAHVYRASRRPGALVLFGGGLLALFAGMRSGIDLVLMSYGLLAWIALAWGINHFRK